MNVTLRCSATHATQETKSSGRGFSEARRRVARATGLGLLLAFAALPSSAWAQTPGEQNAKAGAEPAAKHVDFARDIYPLLRRSCFECHGPDKQEGDLRLDQREQAFEWGLIDAGNPDDSELLRRITLPKGDPEIMPAVGEPLRQREIALVRRWIQQGAEWPEQLEVRRHWAYVPPERPTPPEVSDPQWIQSPLDAFVLRRLDEAGLRPSPPADPETLVRRLFLDVIGLPPSPEEVDAFLADPSDEGLERLVDDLLRRPQFGERWGRHWLDLARYADSHGFQRDNLRDIWAYRDWVIQALNDDMPFDQFTIEQIAGDLLPDATESQRIATGFHRCTPTNVEAGSLPEETRIEQVIDRVNTTGAVWLGTTLECSQCHDHKYDPFTMKDYYRLLAFYNSTQREADRATKSPSSIKFLGPSMPLSDSERDERREQLQRQLADVKRQRTERRKELAETLTAWAAGLNEQLADAPRTHVLRVTEFDSLGTTDSHQILDDGSVLLIGGDPPAEDEYTVRVEAELENVRAFRLDVLTHDSLPGKGPGRGDAQRTNFVLNEFTARVLPAAAVAQVGEKPAAGESREPPREIKLASATADFSQKGWDVAGAIDGDAATGWAISPQFGKDHWATFILQEPLNVTPETPLVFQLAQHWGQARTIGRFRLSAVTGNLQSAAVPEAITKILDQSPDQWTDKQREQLIEHRAGQDKPTAALDRQMKSLEKQIERLEPDTTLVMIELSEPRPTHIFERGDYRKPGEPVRPGTPEVLHAMPEGPPNRLTLARWLVDRKNPLVARVTVNRWWAELFGRGIVATVEDFGIKGEPPTHPELLDWLAVEFMDNGWSLKHLLKTILLSSTYRQSSRVTPALLEADAENLLLARGPSFRMDAEMIRDNALAISGLLSFQQFGPPIRPYQPAGIWSKVGGTAYNYEVSPGDEQYRRGIYVVLKRGSPYPSFMNFDASARLACTVKRSRTNTPLQALTLLNDPVYVEAARGLVRRVRDERPDASLDEQLAHAFRLCTARRPNDAELATLKQLFQAQRDASAQRQAAQPEATSSDGAAKPAGESENTFQQEQERAAGESAAWYSVATTLLNLHETITKP